MSSPRTWAQKGLRVRVGRGQWTNWTDSDDVCGPVVEGGGGNQPEVAEGSAESEHNSFKSSVCKTAQAFLKNGLVLFQVWGELSYSTNYSFGHKLFCGFSREV